MVTSKKTTKAKTKSKVKKITKPKAKTVKKTTSKRGTFGGYTVNLQVEKKLLSRSLVKNQCLQVV